MRVRCNNPNNESFKYYGGRGITVCERWNDFWVFAADMGTRPKGNSLDRIDPNGNYEPGNCRWATVAEQNRNKRSVRKLMVGRVPLLTKDVAAIIGCDRTHVGKLTRKGLTLSEVLAKFGYQVIPASDLPYMGAWRNR